MSAAPKIKPIKDVPAEPAINCKSVGHHLSDLVVPAEKIRHFAEMDLGRLDHLPAGRQDLIALSIVTENAFITNWKSVLALIAEDHEDIPQKVLEAVAVKLVPEFIERYGVLGLLSGSVLQFLWEATASEV